MVDRAGLQQLLPREPTQLYGGIEAHASRSRIDRSISSAFEQRLDAFWFRGKAVADRVVSHRRRRDRRELFIVVIEGVGVDAEQRTESNLAAASTRGRRQLRSRSRRSPTSRRGRGDDAPRALRALATKHRAYRAAWRNPRSFRGLTARPTHTAASSATASRAAFQFQASNSCSWLFFVRPETIRSRTSVSQASGSRPLSFAVLTSDDRIAQVSPLRSEPQNSHDLRPKAISRSFCPCWR